MENRYFSVYDENGIFLRTCYAHPLGDKANNSLWSQPPSNEQEWLNTGVWPRLNSAGNGWDLVEDHRGEEGWIGGEWFRVIGLGPLPEGWNATAPERGPTGEEQQTMPKAEANAVLLDWLLKVTAETAALSASEMAVVSKGGYFDAWQAGQTYAAGKRLVHGEIVYVVMQPVTSQAHQPPGSEGMLTIYRPVDLRT